MNVHADSVVFNRRQGGRLAVNLMDTTKRQISRMEAVAYLSSREIYVIAEATQTKTDQSDRRDLRDLIVEWRMDHFWLGGPRLSFQTSSKIKVGGERPIKYSGAPHMHRPVWGHGAMTRLNATGKPTRSIFIHIHMSSHRTRKNGEGKKEYDFLQFSMKCDRTGFGFAKTTTIVVATEAAYYPVSPFTAYYYLASAYRKKQFNTKTFRSLLSTTQQQPISRF